MKLMFFSTQETNNLLTTAYGERNQDRNDRNSATHTYSATFSEEFEMDVVEKLDENNKVVEIIHFEDAIAVIAHHLNVEIKNFDVMELGDYGTGYTFFLG